MNNDTNKSQDNQNNGGMGLPPIPNVPEVPPSPTPPAPPVVPTPPSVEPVIPTSPPETTTPPLPSPEPKVDSGLPELPKIEVKVTEAAPATGMPRVEEKIEDKKMEVTVKTSSSGEPKPKRKISKRAVIASAIMAIFVAVLGVLAYQLPQFSGEQRGRATGPCNRASGETTEKFCTSGVEYQHTCSGGPCSDDANRICGTWGSETPTGNNSACGGGGSPTCGGCDGEADGSIGGCNSPQGGVGRCVCDHWEYTPTAACPDTRSGGGTTCSGSSPTASCCFNQAPGAVTCGGVAGTCNLTDATNRYCSFTIPGICTVNQCQVCGGSSNPCGGTTSGSRKCNSEGSGWVYYTGTNCSTATVTATATATAAPTATVTILPGPGGGTVGPCAAGLSCTATTVNPPGGSFSCTGNLGTVACCPSGLIIVSGMCTSGACGSRANQQTCDSTNLLCASNLRCSGGFCTSACGNNGQRPCCDGCHSGLPVNSGTGFCGTGISSTADGIGGCCDQTAPQGSLAHCPSGQTCNTGNLACASGNSCTPPLCSTTVLSTANACNPNAPATGTSQCRTSGGIITNCCPSGQRIVNGACQPIVTATVTQGASTCTNTTGTCAGKPNGYTIDNQGNQTTSANYYCRCTQRDNGTCACIARPGLTPTPAPNPTGGASCAGAGQSCNTADCCTGQNLYCQGNTGARSCQQDNGTGGNCGAGGVCGGTQGFRGHRCSSLTSTGECLDNGQTFNTWDAARTYSAQNGCGQVDEICVGGTRPGTLCGDFEIINTSCGGATTTLTTTATTTTTTTVTQPPGTTLACVNTRIFINSATTPATQPQMNALRIGDTIRMVVQGNAASLVGGRFIVRINGNDVSAGGFLVTNNLTPIQASGAKEFYYDYPITLAGTYAIEGYVNTVPPTVTATVQPTATITGTGVAGDCTFTPGQYCDVSGGIVAACTSSGGQQGEGACPNIGTQRQVCCAPVRVGGASSATLGAEDDRSPLAAFVDELANRLKNLVSPKN